MRSTPSLDLRAQIETAWRNRMDQEVEKSYSLFLGLKGRNELSNLEKATMTLGDAAAAADLYLLGASLARAQRNLEHSEKIIREVENFIVNHVTSPHFRLLQEKGLNALLKGQYFDALELFTSASMAAPQPQARASALFNVLACRDNLSLPFDQTLNELKIELGRMEKQGETAQGLAAQVRTLEMRRAFQAGQLKKVFPAPKTPTEKISQDSFFRLWARSLPYHAYFKLPDREEVEFFSTNFKQLHQGGFRFRTLCGTLHPDDLRQSSLSHIADRIYLWTWRWLQDPKKFPVKRILTLLSQSQVCEKASTLTHEDSQILRNALLWLSLFGYADYSRTQRMVQELRNAPSEDYPLLELEKLVIETLYAWRDGKDLLVEDLLGTIESHPLWKSDELFFKDIVEQILKKGGSGSDPKKSFPILSELIESGRKLRPLEREADQATPWIVDIARNQISHAGTSFKTVSEPLTKALALLAAQGSVSCEEFALECLSLHTYDSFVHERAIYNVLARLKQLFKAELKFRVKSGRVLSEGKWQKIRFLEAGLPTEQMRHEQEWQEFFWQKTSVSTSGPEKLAPEDLRPLLTQKKNLSRLDLEAILKRPRSTVNRILAGWMKKNWATSSGTARSTRYHLSEKAVGAILEGRL